MGLPRPNPTVPLKVLEDLCDEADRARTTHIAVSDLRHAIELIRAERAGTTVVDL
jgi:hypothetical protein